MDRLASMAVFVKAVDLGSFAAAASALDLSPPMVGKHVRQLEERLGARLLNRTTRRQSLTDPGRAYYERCRVVLAEAEAADALAADHASEPRGRLRVTMPTHFGRYCVLPILTEFQRRHPALELELSLGDRFADLAEDGYDLAIRTGDLGDLSGVVGRRLAHQRMLVCAAPAYLKAHGEPSGIDDLGGHRAILYRRAGFRLQPWLFPREGEPPLEILPQSRLKLDDLAAIADAATAGMGLAWLPSWLIADRIHEGALVPLLSHQPPHLYPTYALWLKTPHLPLKTRLAIDALAAGLPGMMG
ncbi:HTH-type transcriptional regulator DmlR [Pleomorphomonas sp. T1.2MG-36]|uniref:LysR family transcriptional regulator n=1 Tax=Pleomorphomonas sp. T1.2MG-36 TaxID=3041167 RepID=UPI0024772F42|nr:LysR family transcriptional regulator [Pleomorphomonas sp. T1.2MG-36]CAI9404725.1 HTH-type transcriptional regulator DmlR [Pleomorphomonas sp. T1.2MG-36]